MFNLRNFLFENKTIQCVVEAADWQEAVRKSVLPLIEKGFVEERYYQAILDNYAANGPYFVIAPGLAMPHARPENGVIKSCFSLVILKDTVDFKSDNDPVKILFTIAATEAKFMNEEVIPQVFELFDCDEAIEALKAAKDGQDVDKAFVLAGL